MKGGLGEAEVDMDDRRTPEIEGGRAGALPCIGYFFAGGMCAVYAIGFSRGIHYNAGRCSV